MAQGERLRLGLVQLTSTDRPDENLPRVERLVREAASSGSQLVALPENFACLRSEGKGPVWAEPLDGALVTRMGRLARDLGIWLLLGSIPEESADAPKIHNTSVLLRPDGTYAAVYRKIHLFDAAIAGGAEMRESETVLPGDEIVTARTPWGVAGLSVCYDLRFPELYRRLAFAGAVLVFVPSAFTARTGPPHWEVLLRARAIENQCFVAAPAQTGRHCPSRESHGHSMIVDPWGTIVAELPSGEGVLRADLDMGLVAEVRSRLPCLEHVPGWLRPTS